MNPKLKIIASSWEEKAKTFRSSHPLKVLKTLPNMEGITSDTAKNLKAKGFGTYFAMTLAKSFFAIFSNTPFVTRHPFFALIENLVVFQEQETVFSMA